MCIIKIIVNFAVLQTFSVLHWVYHVLPLYPKLYQNKKLKQIVHAENACLAFLSFNIQHFKAGRLHFAQSYKVRLTTSYKVRQ